MNPLLMGFGRRQRLIRFGFVSGAEPEAPHFHFELEMDSLSEPELEMESFEGD